MIFSLGSFAIVLPAHAGVVQFSGKQIFVDFDGLPFTLNNWAPGMSDQKQITIKNDESFKIDVYFRADKTAGDDILANALTLTVGPKVQHLKDWFTGDLLLGSIAAGQSQNYKVMLNFDSDAGNIYQSKTINFDFILTAAQQGSGNGGGTGGGASVIIPGGGYTAPTQPTVPTTDNGRVTATPGEGGITTLPNPDGGQVKLVIPAGAVEDDTLFSITPVVMGALTLPSAEQGLFVVDGFAYRITATRNGQPVTTFSQPLIFTITYTDKQVAGFNLSSLNLYTFQNGVWSLVGSQVNPSNHTITSSINHLTLFALLGTKEGNNQPIPQVIKPAVKGSSTVVSNGGVTSSVTGGQGTNQSAGVTGGKKSEETQQPSTKVPSGGNVTVKPSPKGLRGFLANVGTAWKNLNKTTFFSLLGLILALILILIGLKIWRKRKQERRVK